MNPANQLNKSMPKEKLIEICRSFSYHKNLGNYEGCDFFASQKVECKESEAEEKSKALYEFVKNEVIKSVNSYMAEKSPKKELKSDDKENKREEGEEFNKKYIEDTKLADIEQEVKEGETNPL